MLAVYIPVYDRPDLLDLLLWSLSRQSFQDFQIHIYIDGGPRDFMQGVRTWGLDPVVHWVGPETEVFRGDLLLNWLSVLPLGVDRILRLDGDTVADPGLVEEHVRFGKTRNLVASQILILPWDSPGVEGFQERLRFPLLQDCRAWHNPGEFEFTSAWGGSISYPLEAFREVKGVRSCFTGQEQNGETDLAARMIHHAGCSLVYWPRARTYAIYPQQGLEPVVDYALAGHDPNRVIMEMRGRVEGYRVSRVLMEEALGFPLQDISELVPVPHEEYWDKVMVPRCLADDRTVSKVVLRTARDSRKVT